MLTLKQPVPPQTYAHRGLRCPIVAQKPVRALGAVLSGTVGRHQTPMPKRWDISIYILAIHRVCPLKLSGKVQG